MCLSLKVHILYAVILSTFVMESLVFCFGNLILFNGMFQYIYVQGGKTLLCL